MSRTFVGFHGLDWLLNLFVKCMKKNVEIFNEVKKDCHPRRTLKYVRSLSSPPSRCCCFCYETSLATTYDLFEMGREILFMFLWHLAPVVADVTLGVRAPPSPVLKCSQKQRHAGKPDTVRRAGHEMSLCTCVVLGGRDSALGLSAIQPPTGPPRDSSSLENQNYTRLRYGKSVMQQLKKVQKNIVVKYI